MTTTKCECASVSITHTVYIPARSILEITGKVQGSVSNGDTYLLGGTVGHLHQLPEQHIMRPSDNKVIVRVLNLQKQSITLHRNTTIVVTQLIDSVCVAATDTPGPPQASNPTTSEKQQFLWHMAQQSQDNLSKIKQLFSLNCY